MEEAVAREVAAVNAKTMKRALEHTTGETWVAAMPDYITDLDSYAKVIHAPRALAFVKEIKEKIA